LPVEEPVLVVPEQVSPVEGLVVLAAVGFSLPVLLLPGTLQ